MSVDVYKDYFKNRQKAKEEAEKNKGNKSNNFTEYEQVEYLGLNPGKYYPFRIVSKIHIHPEYVPGDAKIILFSEILKDNKKSYAKVNWKFIENKEGDYEIDPDWFLSRVYNTVTKDEWVKYTEADIDNDKIKMDSDGKIVNEKGYNGRYVAINKGKPSYERIVSNSKKTDKYPPAFKPKTKVLLNVIDRSDDWCQNNNHTKMLVTKANESSFTRDDGSVQTNIFADAGISFSMYEQIGNHFLEFRNDWNIDVAIKRHKNGDQWTFSIMDAADERKLPEELKSVMNENPLTDEEKKYKMYDFDTLYPVCSYYKIKRDFINLIKQVDIDCGTSFENELDDLVKKEKEEFVKKNEENKENTDSKEGSVVSEISSNDQPEQKKEGIVSDKDTNTNESPIPKVAPTRRVAEKVEEVSSTEGENDITSIFPKFYSISQEFQNYMIESIVKFKNGIPVYKIEDVNVIPCDNPNCTYSGTKIRTELPDMVMECPVCGMKFEV